MTSHLLFPNFPTQKLESINFLFGLKWRQYIRWFRWVLNNQQQMSWIIYLDGRAGSSEGCGQASRRAPSRAPHQDEEHRQELLRHRARRHWPRGDQAGLHGCREGHRDGGHRGGVGGSDSEALHSLIHHLALSRVRVAGPQVGKRGQVRQEAAEVAISTGFLRRTLSVCGCVARPEPSWGGPRCWGLGQQQQRSGGAALSTWRGAGVARGGPRP